MERDEDRLDEITDALIRDEISAKQARQQMAALGLARERIDFIMSGLETIDVRMPPRPETPLG